MGSVCEQIIESESLIQWLDFKIDGLEIQADLRSRVVGGCLNTVSAHQKGIVLLVSKKIYASAFALVRIIFEAYIRGVWLHQCATEQDLEKFEKDKLEKKIGDFIKEIEKLEGWNNCVLSDAKKAKLSSMHNFTHTGFNQIVRQNKEATIESNYTDKEIIEVISFTNAIGILSVIEIAHLAQNEVLANEVLEKAKQVLRLSLNDTSYI